MKTLFLFLLLFSGTIFTFAQTPVERYPGSAKEDRPAIFADFLKEYCDLSIDAEFINISKITSLENQVKKAAADSTKDVKEAIFQIESGNKVVFFVDNSLFGGLEMGFSKSTSWDMDFPFASGFYWWTDKSFNDEGLNFHCGKKEKNPQFRFYIFKNK